MNTQPLGYHIGNKWAGISPSYIGYSVKECPFCTKYSTLIWEEHGACARRGKQSKQVFRATFSIVTLHHIAQHQSQAPSPSFSVSFLCGLIFSSQAQISKMHDNHWPASTYLQNKCVPPFLRPSVFFTVCTSLHFFILYNFVLTLLLKQNFYFQP